MSSIAGWASPAVAPDGGTHVRALLARMPDRGADASDIWSGERSALGVSRFAWEREVAPWSDALIGRSGKVTLVADASLYDTTALARELSRLGQPPAGQDAAAIMLSAYRAWGPAFAPRLNGDFAFILWDEAREELLAGRDFVGRRALFTRDMPDGVAIASQSRALALAVGQPPRINRDFVAASVAGLLSGSRESPFEGIRPVPAGAVLRWSARSGWSEAARWESPRFAARGRSDLREGAVELRGLLELAVADRSPGSTIAIFLSGGADSPAVLGAACSARARGISSASYQTVSVSFPEGDSARENEHIEAVDARWGLTPHWIDSESMQLFGSHDERVAKREDPYAHTFEQMNRYLGRAARELGARVVLDGHGGDLLFQVSQSCVAELLFAGDLMGWRRMLQEGEYRTWREILRLGIAPALPEMVWRAIDVFRPQPLQRPFEQGIPGWITKGVRQSLKDRGWTRAELTRGIFEGPAAFESRWYMTAPYMSRALSWTHDFALQGGLEVRSPLLDKRVVEFAASRPVSERASIRESKRLLRESMRGLIPESVLAPRPYKTGVPRGYFHRQMAANFTAVAYRVFGEEPGSTPSTVALSELGILDLEAFRSALAEYLKTEDHLTGVQLFLTVEAELWLRAREGLKL
ncbi:MAG: asparagine synthase-related protein [Gemmatimonadaceae bacterium]